MLLILAGLFMAATAASAACPLANDVEAATRVQEGNRYFYHMQPKTSYASLSCPVDTALAVWASQGQYDAIVAIAAGDAVYTALHIPSNAGSCTDSGCHGQLIWTGQPEEETFDEAAFISGGLAVSMSQDQDVPELCIAVQGSDGRAMQVDCQDGYDFVCMCDDEGTPGPTTTTTTAPTSCSDLPVAPAASLLSAQWDGEPVPIGGTVDYVCGGRRFAEDFFLNVVSVTCLDDLTWKVPDPWPICVETVTCATPPGPPESGGSTTVLNAGLSYGAVCPGSSSGGSEDVPGAAGTCSADSAPTVFKLDGLSTSEEGTDTNVYLLTVSSPEEQKGVFLASFSQPVESSDVAVVNVLGGQPTSDVGTVQSTSSATSLIITVVLFETTTNEMHLSVSFPTGGQEPCLSHVTCDFCNGAEEVGNPTCHSVKADFKNNAYQKQDHTKYGSHLEYRCSEGRSFFDSSTDTFSDIHEMTCGWDGEWSPAGADALPPCADSDPVDGAWADWGDWTTCSVSCGGGIWSRERTCSDPTPARGGEECEGEDGEIGQCQDVDCPIESPIVEVPEGEEPTYELWKTKVTVAAATDNTHSLCRAACNETCDLSVFRCSGEPANKGSVPGIARSSSPVDPDDPATFRVTCLCTRSTVRRHPGHFCGPRGTACRHWTYRAGQSAEDAEDVWVDGLNTMVHGHQGSFDP